MKNKVLIISKDQHDISFATSYFKDSECKLQIIQHKLELSKITEREVPNVIFLDIHFEGVHFNVQGGKTGLLRSAELVLFIGETPKKNKWEYDPHTCRYKLKFKSSLERLIEANKFYLPDLKTALDRSKRKSTFKL